MAEFLKGRLPLGDCAVRADEVGDGTLNLLFDWSGTGCPSFVFCTHLDTVPPYIPPEVVSVRKETFFRTARPQKRMTQW